MRWVRSNRSAGVWLVLALIVVGFLDGNRAWSGPVELGGEVAHEEAPSDPWMPRSGEIPPGVQVRCEPVVLGPYKSVQVNVDEFGCNIPGDAANEPSIAIDPTNPRRMAIGWRQFDTVQSDFRQAGWGYSHDAGRTWTFPGVLGPNQGASDPVLGFDSSGRFYYLSVRLHDGLNFYLFHSQDGGISWPTHTVSWYGDKPWFTVDRTGGVSDGFLYFLVYGAFRRSTDGGITTSPPVASHPTVSLAGTITVGANGTVYFVGDNGRVARSSNAWDASVVPTIDFVSTIYDPSVYDDGSGGNTGGGLNWQAWIAYDPADDSPTVYSLFSLCLRDLPQLDPSNVYFVRSTDRGVTWSAPFRVNDDPDHPRHYQWFTMMSVAPNGRIDVVWNDTRHSEQINLCELYYSYSIDAGLTWSPNIQVSPMFDSWLGGPVTNPKLGDYYHMWSDNLGANVAYAATFNGEHDVYYLRIGPYDCNGNEIPDENDIADGVSLDCNENDVPDECEYRGDFNGDRLTALDDYFAYTQCRTAPDVEFATPCCGLFDIEPDGDADLADFAFVQRAFAVPGP